MPKEYLLKIKLQLTDSEPVYLKGATGYNDIEVNKSYYNLDKT